LAQGLSGADIQNLAAYFASLSCNATPSQKPAGDTAAGKVLARNCAACHGETGAGANPAWPKLAAQKPGYLVNALKAFRAGLRKDPMMSGAANNLSDANIADLAAYFATQTCQSTK
jgi:cytochrome c553